MRGVGAPKDADQEKQPGQRIVLEHNLPGTAQADVKFKSISGLRVSSSAIRFEGIQKGVYIIRGEKLAFRPVDVLYEGAGFVVCREANPEAEPDCLQQYDDVVIEGAQLYDGKPA